MDNVVCKEQPVLILFILGISVFTVQRMQAESRNPVRKKWIYWRISQNSANVGEWIKSRASDRDMD